MKQIIEESNHIYFLRFSASFLAIIYECECLRKSDIYIYMRARISNNFVTKFIHIMLTLYIL
jgi:hypothetical protein